MAEVIYFLRNGNLYRRVFLVVPDRADVDQGGVRHHGANGAYRTSIFGGQQLKVELAGDE